MLKKNQFLCAFISCLVTIAINSSFFDQKEDTPLIQAVRSEDKKTVKKLLKSDINVNELGQDYKTALDLAVEYGYLKIALILSKYGGKVTTLDNQKWLQEMLKSHSEKFLFGNNIIAFIIGFQLALGLACISPIVLLPWAMVIEECSLISGFIFTAITLGLLSIGFFPLVYILTTVIRTEFWFRQSNKNWIIESINDELIVADDHHLKKYSS